MLHVSAEVLKNLHRAVIEEALSQSSGSVKEAISLLRVPRKTFYDKLAKYGIQRRSFVKDWASALAWFIPQNVDLISPVFRDLSVCGFSDKSPAKAVWLSALCTLFKNSYSF